MSEEKIVSAALIIIGNEILSGRTKDANLPHIAQTLNEVGFRITEVQAAGKPRASKKPGRRRAGEVAQSTTSRPRFGELSRSDATGYT